MPHHPVQPLPLFPLLFFLKFTTSTAMSITITNIYTTYTQCSKSDQHYSHGCLLRDEHLELGYQKYVP